jgi:DNA polymerase (family 10)
VIQAPGNSEIADILERVADLLEADDANPFRVRSYRNAAMHLRGSKQAAADLYRAEGVTGLRHIEGVGEGLSRAIAQIIETGRSTLLDRLAGESAPETLFASLPGIGTRFAHRIRDELGISTLEELEQAAHDGRLARVEGIGRKRVAGIRDALGGILSARRFYHPVPAPPERPTVAMLLAVDAVYRERSARNELPTIAPRRFNPEHKQWLPILHTTRDGWELTALFSNTKHAHDLGKTNDWVVIYYHRNHREDQCTVVTGRYGALAGRRIVRGREAECRRHYAAAAGVERDVPSAHHSESSKSIQTGL